MSSAAENKQIISDAYTAMAAGDIKGFIGVLDPEIVISEPACLPYGGTFTGLGEVMGMFAKAGPVLDSGRLKIEELSADDDRVAAVIRVPLRDGSGEARIAEHWRLRDGKATALDVFWADPTIVANGA